MSVSELVFFLEGPSEREMLKGFLPKVLPEHVIPRYVVFEGKQDLERQLPGKLRAWKAPDACFVVLRDKDGGDCRKIKANLLEICCDAKRPDTLVRIACHELESWYLGDLKAVESGLGLVGLAGKQKNAKYRTPDALANPAQELQRITKKAYQKVAGSREIGSRLSLDSNLSHSFNVFVSGVNRLVNGISQ